MCCYLKFLWHLVLEELSCETHQRERQFRAGHKQASRSGVPRLSTYANVRIKSHISLLFITNFGASKKRPHFRRVVYWIFIRSDTRWYRTPSRVKIVWIIWRFRLKARTESFPGCFENRRRRGVQKTNLGSKLNINELAGSIFHTIKIINVEGKTCSSWCFRQLIL